MTTNVHNVVIIGSGPAGLTAAIYTSRARLKPLVVSGFQAGGPAGGQLMMTTEVENYPGFPEAIHGSHMMEEFRKQAARFGTEFLDACDVVRADFSQRPFKVSVNNFMTGEEQTLLGQSVIIATGASANWLGCKGEEEFKNRGVSACAVCDGALPLFRDKDLVVVGGGDSAVEEGSYLTKYAKMVHMVVRRDVLRASKIMQDRAKSNPKIKLLWNTTVEEIKGDDVVTEAVLKDVKSGKTRAMKVGGVFMAIGHTPNTQALKDQVKCDEKGYVLLPQPGRTFTSVDGVFAAGDVADSIYRQAVSAAGTGCMAAIDCERWLEAHGGH